MIQKPTGDVDRHGREKYTPIVRSEAHQHVEGGEGFKEIEIPVSSLIN